MFQLRLILNAANFVFQAAVHLPPPTSCGPQFPPEHSNMLRYQHTAWFGGREVDHGGGSRFLRNYGNFTPWHMQKMMQWRCYTSTLQRPKLICLLHKVSVRTSNSMLPLERINC